MKRVLILVSVILSVPMWGAERGLNKGWTFWSEKDQRHIAVDLPHDAMLHEQRDPDLPSGEATGYFPGGFYHYEKHLDVPESWLKKHGTRRV